MATINKVKDIIREYRSSEITEKTAFTEIVNLVEGEGVEQTIEHLESCIQLLEKSKQAFKSKTIAEAREFAGKAKEIMENLD